MGERTLGGCLQAERLRNRLSVEQVAKATKINPYYIKAMERDDLHLLPARIYVKGYIRSVCALLGLEATDFYSMLPSEAPPPLRSARSRLC
ncbi:MAG: helix-turn-helix transcriptional regulator [Pseudomonadota bacterium]